MNKKEDTRPARGVNKHKEKLQRCDSFRDLVALEPGRTRSYYKRKSGLSYDIVCKYINELGLRDLVRHDARPRVVGESVRLAVENEPGKTTEYYAEKLEMAPRAVRVHVRKNRLQGLVLHTGTLTKTRKARYLKRLAKAKELFDEDPTRDRKFYAETLGVCEKQVTLYARKLGVRRLGPLCTSTPFSLAGKESPVEAPRELNQWTEAEVVELFNKKPRRSNSYYSKVLGASRGFITTLRRRLIKAGAFFPLRETEKQLVKEIVREALKDDVFQPYADGVRRARISERFFHSVVSLHCGDGNSILDEIAENSTALKTEEYIAEVQAAGGVGVNLPPGAWERYLEIREARMRGKNFFTGGNICN